MSQKLCIWCRHDTAVVGTNKSHIFPAALWNNQGQQVLPPGIVCKGCYSLFSRDVEPEFMADPFVHISAVAHELTNRSGKKGFATLSSTISIPQLGTGLTTTTKSTSDICSHIQHSSRSRTRSVARLSGITLPGGLPSYRAGRTRWLLNR